MIICSCNVLSDGQLSDAIAQGAHRPREVYAACGCKAECGNCARTILTLIREAQSTVTEAVAAMLPNSCAAGA
jgi:bacterioferritin-associated ferredoxin